MCRERGGGCGYGIRFDGHRRLRRASGGRQKSGCVSFSGRFRLVQIFRMFFQQFFPNLAEPVVEGGLLDSVTAHVFICCQTARPAVDDDLLPVSELVLVHGIGKLAQNENLQTRVSWDSCTSWPSFETLPTMNALSDYLTKSGREESGGLLGAYLVFLTSCVLPKILLPIIENVLPTQDSTFRGLLILKVFTHPSAKSAMS